MEKINLQKIELVVPGVRNRTLSSQQLLVLLSGTTLVVMANMYTTQPILPQIGREFDVTPSEAALTVSLLVLMIGLSSFFYGFIIDHFGPRKVIVGSMLALLLPTLLCAVAPGFFFLVLARIGQGLVLPGVISGVLAYLHSEYTVNRGTAIGYYSAGNIIGGFSGRLIGGLLTDFFNWRGAFIGFTFLNLLTVLLVLNFLPEAKNYKADSVLSVLNLNSSSRSTYKQRLGQTLRTAFSHLRNGRLLRIYLISAAISFPFMGLFIYLPYYLSRPPFNLSTLLVSSIFVVYLVGILAAPLCGKLGDLYGRQTLILLGLIVMGIGILLALIQSLLALVIGLLLICFGMFSVQATNNAFLGDNVPAGKGRGSAVSMQHVFFYLGSSLGGSLTGLLWQNGSWFLVGLGCEISILLGLAAIITFKKEN